MVAKTKSAPTTESFPYSNRELSWLEFNQRVLDQALDSSTPLLERVKFFCITNSNLDEFFEVRVAGVQQQIESDVVERGLDGMTASESMRTITRRVRRMVEDTYRCWRDELYPQLAEKGIRFIDLKKCSPTDRAWLGEYYLKQVRPVLTPLALDPSHPFPQLSNKSLNLIVQVEAEKNGELGQHLAVVQVPRVLPRLVRLPRPDGGLDFAFLGMLIGHHLKDLFPGTKILDHWMFRVTRNSELYIDEEEVSNVLQAVEEELHNRRKGDAVRLEIEKDAPPAIRERLLSQLHLTEDDLYVIDGPLNPTRLMTIYEGDHSPELRDAPFVATTAPALRGVTDLFAAIRERDFLLHHPYESFSTVVEFLEKAAEDPRVLAIKQTLYRTGGDPRIVGALMKAVRNGKQVTVVVELRARFDEANNILWSQRLEDAGVHVVYGLVGYKIHAKMTLVVRRDDDGIRRYLHLGTGNYNPSTARLYTDLSLFTSRPEFGEDATNLFNLLTGICQFQDTRKLVVAPFQLHDRIVDLIDRETTNATRGLPSRIIAKMNSLVDPEVIEAMYRASTAGVEIDLIIRGVCCLKPGIKGISERIRVRSIIDRYLEHSRIFYFENACQPQVFIGSADWMPRNFFKRIEVVFPIDDGILRARIIDEILALPLLDNVKARLLKADGTYQFPKIEGDAKPVRSQQQFIELALKAGRRGPRTRAKANQRPSVEIRTKPVA